MELWERGKNRIQIKMRERRSVVAAAGIFSASSALPSFSPSRCLSLHHYRHQRWKKRKEGDAARPLARARTPGGTSRSLVTPTAEAAGSGLVHPGRRKSCARSFEGEGGQPATLLRTATPTRKACPTSTLSTQTKTPSLPSWPSSTRTQKVKYTRLFNL